MQGETMRRGLARGLMLGVLLGVVLTAGGAGAGSNGWEHVGVGATPTAPSLNAAVNALAVEGSRSLLVGGAFENAGGVADADYIASWDGTRWHALGASRLAGAVNAIAYGAGKV